MRSDVVSRARTLFELDREKEYATMPLSINSAQMCGGLRADNADRERDRASWTVNGFLSFAEKSNGSLVNLDALFGPAPLPQISAFSVQMTTMSLISSLLGWPLELLPSAMYVRATVCPSRIYELDYHQMRTGAA
jgi:hypothetical protein